MNPTARIHSLVVMALADGSLGEREVNYLADRCVELGLGETELRDALQRGLQDDAAVSLPTDPAEAESLLGDLLRMMAADGALSESEKRLFAVCAAKLGLGLSEVDALIDRLLRK